MSTDDQSLPDRFDIVRYSDPHEPDESIYRAVPSGYGEIVVDAHQREHKTRERIRTIAIWAGPLVAVGVGYALNHVLIGVVSALIVFGAFVIGGRDDARLPEVAAERLSKSNAEHRYNVDIDPSNYREMLEEQSTPQ